MSINWKRGHLEGRIAAETCQKTKNDLIPGHSLKPPIRGYHVDKSLPYFASQSEVIKLHTGEIRLSNLFKIRATWGSYIEIWQISTRIHGQRQILGHATLRRIMKRIFQHSTRRDPCRQGHSSSPLMELLKKIPVIRTNAKRHDVHLGLVNVLGIVIIPCRCLNTQLPSNEVNSGHLKTLMSISYPPSGSWSKESQTGPFPS